MRLAILFILIAGVALAGCAAPVSRSAPTCAFDQSNFACNQPALLPNGTLTAEIAYSADSQLILPPSAICVAGDAPYPANLSAWPESRSFIQTQTRNSSSGRFQQLVRLQIPCRNPDGSIVSVSPNQTFTGRLYLTYSPMIVSMNIPSHTASALLVLQAP